LRPTSIIDAPGAARVTRKPWGRRFSSVMALAFVVGSTILAVAADKRTPEQQAALSAHYRSLDADMIRLSAIVGQAKTAHEQYRLQGAQDLTWALLNSPAFLFNR